MKKSRLSQRLFVIRYKRRNQYLLQPEDMVNSKDDGNSLAKKLKLAKHHNKF